MLCRFQFYSLIISWNFLKTINIVLFLESHPVSRGWLSPVMNQFYYCQWLYDLSGISRDLRFTHTWVHITTSTSPKLNSVNWRNSYHISIVLTSSAHTHTGTPLHLSICFPHAMFSPTNEPTSAERPLVSYHRAAKCQRRMRRKRERQTICPSNGEEGRRKTEKRRLGWRKGLGTQKLNTEDPKVDLPNVTVSGVYRGRPSSWVSYEFFQ